MGRVPEGMLAAFEIRQQLEKFQLAMDAAISSEDFEKAAALRDEMKKLEQASQSTKPAAQTSKASSSD